MLNFILSCSILLLFQAPLFAQFANGQAFLGGSLGLSYSENSPDLLFTGPFFSTSNSRNLDIFINPAAGLFLNQRQAVGLRLGFAYFQTKPVNSNTNNLETQVTRYSIAPFYRNFWMFAGKLGMIHQIYLEAGASVGESELQGGNFSFKETSFGVVAGYSPHLVYFLNDQIGLEAGFGNLYLGFQNSDSMQTNNPDQSRRGFEFNLNLQTSLFFSCFYYFKKRED